MWHGPSPKMAWSWFSPSTAKQRGPPFFRHWNSSLRKYQQRGRCATLPPTVPAWRILGRAHLGRGLDERRVQARGARVLDELDERGGGADAQPAVRHGRDRPVEVLDVHEAVRLRHVVLHQAEQVHAAGDGQDPAPPGAERGERLLLVRGVDVGKGFHFTPPIRCGSSAVSTLAGVIGRCRMRAPIAFDTALAIAAAVEIVGGSPSPTTPRAG